MTIDLRSDTVTKPCRTMRQLMAEASVGDDFYRDDPSVIRLEQMVSRVLGHEAALFVPSGTMANQLAVRVLVDRGEELIAETDSHLLGLQQAAAASLFGIQSRTVRGDRGRMNVDEVLEATRDREFGVPTRAVAVELTHNRGGGSIYDFSTLKDMSSRLAVRGVALHCDGARIWNAHVATGVPLAEYGALFDTIAVCFSKGLGAPVGSAIVASEERVDRARTFRRQMGGGMRQAGILASGAMHALEAHLPQLRQDHDKAQNLARQLNKSMLPGQTAFEVDTNIVVWDLESDQGTAQRLVDAARSKGVLVNHIGPARIRLVTHRDIHDAELEQAVQILETASLGLSRNGPR